MDPEHRQRLEELEELANSEELDEDARAELKELRALARVEKHDAKALAKFDKARFVFRIADPEGDFYALDLTTAHAASSYGQPVLLIDGEAYGPMDLTPDGTPAAMLVTDWAARFIRPLEPEARAAVWRNEEIDPAGALAPQMLDLLLQMLELYDSKRLAPPEYFASYWQDLRDMLRKAEALP